VEISWDNGVPNKFSFPAVRKSSFPANLLQDKIRKGREPWGRTKELPPIGTSPRNKVFIVFVLHLSSNNWLLWNV